MNDSTREAALNALLEALLATPLNQETGLDELASRCEGFTRDAYGDYWVVEAEGSDDEVPVDDLGYELDDLADQKGLYLERLYDDRFIPRRMVQDRTIDISQVVGVRLSRRAYGPIESCRQFTYANGRIDVGQGVYYEEPLASATANDDADFTIKRSLECNQVGSWKRWYWSMVDDAGSWELVLTMRDGSVFVSQGNGEWPEGFWGLWQSMVLATFDATILDGDFRRDKDLMIDLSIRD